jgi:hypothetical protein
MSSMGLMHGAGEGDRSPLPTEALFDRPSHTFASLAALPSNVEAIEAGLRFSAGMEPYVALVGPSGWGKSHLLSAAALRMAKSAPPVRLISVADHLRASDSVDVPGVLLLDDCQEVLGKPKMRLMLRLLLERRVRTGRPTMLAFTLPKPTRALSNLLPSERNWITTALEAPGTQERVLLIDQMAAAEGLALSSRLVRIMASQMHGNGRTLSGALKRLRLAGPSWQDASATLRACGLLDPFFSDNPDWDLKIKIVRLAEQNRGRFGRVLPNDLAIYTMLREAGLAESDVARALEIEPSAAYLRATRFAKDVGTDPQAASYVNRFVEIVVESLSVE